MAEAGRALLYQFGVGLAFVATVRRDSFPCEDNEDAFYCTGRVRAVDDPAIRQALAELFVAERSSPEALAPGPADHLFSFGLHSCMLTRTTGHGDPSPKHTVWHRDNL